MRECFNGDLSVVTSLWYVFVDQPFLSYLGKINFCMDFREWSNFSDLAWIHFCGWQSFYLKNLFFPLCLNEQKKLKDLDMKVVCIFPQSIYSKYYACTFLSLCSCLRSIDDDRRALTSDVTAYVNKNPFRVVQFPFKAWITRADDVKRVIGVKPVWAQTSHHLVSENFRLFHWLCSIFSVSTPLKSVKPVWAPSS